MTTPERRPIIAEAIRKYEAIRESLPEPTDEPVIRAAFAYEVGVEDLDEASQELVGAIWDARKACVRKGEILYMVTTYRDDTGGYEHRIRRIDLNPEHGVVVNIDD